MKKTAYVETAAARIGWGFWLLWVLAGLAGLAVGVGILLVLWKAMGGPPHKGVMGAVVGACVGTLQWLVLRRRVSLSIAWVFASVVAWATGAAMELVGGFFVSIVVLAVLAGLLQGLVLRGKAAPAGWWVVANIVGWAAFLGVVAAMAKVVSPAVGLGVGFFGVAAITGLSLVWMLRPVNEP